MMTVSQPRHALPEPFETTSHSSNRPKSPVSNPGLIGPGEHSSQGTGKTEMTSTQLPRRFKPQPIEETTRSSRKQKPEHVEHIDARSHDKVPSPDQSSASASPSGPRAEIAKPRKFAPEPVETSTRTSRKKFAPEPVETTSRSSKTKGPDQQSKPRRFAPEPIETTSKSSKAGKDDDTPASGVTPPRRKFAPEPIATEKISRRRKAQATEDADGSPEQTQKEQSQSSSQSSNGARRFSPELLETAKGTYRQEKKLFPLGPEKASTNSSNKNQEDDEEETDDDVPALSESRFSAASLAKRNYEQQRRHSFAVPDLEIIESDSGDDSSAPSLTNSRSSAESEKQRRNSRRTAGETYTDYVLRLAAQTTSEKDLHDTAMTAYINEVPHHAPGHYGFDDEDEILSRKGNFSGQDGADIRLFRRHSQDDHDWEMSEMRRHHAQLEEAKREFKHDTAGHSRFSSIALATRHKLEAEKQKQSKKVKAAEDTELSKMRAAASPPMAGANLVFPQTISPKMTRCETDQHPRPRCADSDDDEEEIGQQSLWATRVTRLIESNPASPGLWGGCCNGGENSPPVGLQRLGLQTPAHERDNPFETATPGRKTPGNRTPGGSKTPRRRMYGMNLLPLTPQRTNEEESFTSSVDKRLQLERQIEEEFPDSVVTQIYNYLSLGYPSLAWQFDAELSKISRISVEDLRKDDQRMDAKGYAGAPEGDGCKEEDVTGGACRRWEALRLYVREWARQSPNFVLEGNIGGVGMGRGAEGWGGNVGVRKGSWAH
jgi:hypothetical protein